MNIMKFNKILLLIMVISLFLLVGCASSDYGAPPSGPSGAVIGGGCGVAGETPNTGLGAQAVSISLKEVF